MPTIRWLDTMATTQEHNARMKKGRDVLPTHARPNEEKDTYSIPENLSAVKRASSTTRAYIATVPGLYWLSAHGIEAVNMCFLCPRAPECAVTKNTAAQYASADGCTREDVPGGENVRWFDATGKQLEV